MLYLSREVRDEIAELLIRDHNGWIKYRDKQPPHPESGGVQIARAVAESKIKRLRILVKLLSPNMLKERSKTRERSQRRISFHALTTT